MPGLAARAVEAYVERWSDHAPVTAVFDFDAPVTAVFDFDAPAGALF